MFCFRCQKLLVPYAEGALDEKARSRVERHLAGCPSCRAELACVKSVSDALRGSDVPAAEPPPDLWSRVRERIEPQPSPARRKFGLPQTAYAFAGVLLVAVTGWGVFRGGSPADTRFPAVRQAARHVKPDTAPARPSEKQRITAADSHAVPPRAAVPLPEEKPGPAGSGKPPEPAVVAKAPDSSAYYPEIAGGVPARNERIPAAPPAAQSAEDAPALKSAGPAGLLKADQAQPQTSSAAPAAAVRAKDAEHYLELGGSQMAKGQKAEAARTYNRAYLNSDPSLWPRITESVEKAGALEAAAAQAEADFKFGGDRNSGLVLYTLQARRNDTAGMVSTARRLVRLHPEDPELWLKLGEACEAAGDLNGAIQAYRKAASMPDRDVAVRAQERLGRLKPADPARGRE